MPTMLTVFNHVPKTAGSTVRMVLAQQFSGRDFEFTGDLAQYQEFLAEAAIWRGKLALVHGHVPFGVHNRIGEPARCLSFLRRPRERFVSEYTYALRDGDGIYTILKRDNVSLRDLASGRYRFLDHPYVRFLGGSHPADPSQPDAAECFNLAKENIESGRILVGITELFDESLLLLSKDLGWSAPVYSKRNVGVRTLDTRSIAENIPKQLDAQLSTLLGWDEELYAFSLENMRRRIAAQKPQFWRALAELRNVTDKLSQHPGIDKRWPFVIGQQVPEEVLRAAVDCREINRFLGE